MLKIIFKLAAIVLVLAVFGVFGFVLLAIPLVLSSATRGVEWLHGTLERSNKQLERLNKRLDARVEADSERRLNARMLEERLGSYPQGEGGIESEQATGPGEEARR